jgi:LAO/AO transport system kinase
MSRAEALAAQLLSGDRRALARALTLVEMEAPEGQEILARVYPASAACHVVGFTGAPGVGKSTLVDRLARLFAEDGHRVGVLAVDPSSPFTGGALLGDRIRMDDPHPSVFIRSLATRGQVGGLSRSTAAAVRLMAAAGKDVVLLETVGAGQSEVDVMGHAQTVVVVSVPGLGDDVQANKAGILEIGDVFAVNKADMPGADRLVRELRTMLSLGPARAWTPPIVRTVATEGAGVAELKAAIEDHWRHLTTSTELAARIQREAERELRQALAEAFLERVLERLAAEGAWAEALRRVSARELDPRSAAHDLLAQVKEVLP